MQKDAVADYYKRHTDSGISWVEDGPIISQEVSSRELFTLLDKK